MSAHPSSRTLPTWSALTAHRAAMEGVHLRQLFADDRERFAKLSITVGPLLVDYSKHRVTDDTMRLLFSLAREAGVEAHRDRMLRGEKINFTEDRAVLHTAL